MITAGDFKNGITIEYDGNICQIVEFQHVKPGKGSAFVRTKIKNVVTGSVLEKTFNPSEKYPGAEIEKKEMQYLYEDGGIYYFMDNETYEQLPLNRDQVDEAMSFVKENTTVTIRFFKGEAFSVDPPNFVELQVVEAEPGVRGDTASNVQKNAILETGYRIQVPLFVNQGDTIRVDTRTGEYMERV